MKRMISLLVVALCATPANAYHSGINEATTAANNASCNAAFQNGCSVDDQEEHTDTASSSGFAAPAGVLGGSPLEIALIVALINGAVARRRFQRPGPVQNVGR